MFFGLCKWTRIPSFFVRFPSRVFRFRCRSEMSSVASENTPPPPVVVILGSTGVGKTKLSIELARRYGGEIISADSMQVYRDLDIVTAKATREEQSLVPHHLLDVTTPDHAFTVIHFRDAALPIIDRLLEEKKPPIIVGGTNYYIESVLWQVLVGKEIREERGIRSPRRRSTENDDDRKRVKLTAAPEQTTEECVKTEPATAKACGGEEQESQQSGESESSSSSSAKVRTECDDSEKQKCKKNEVVEDDESSSSACLDDEEVEKVVALATNEMEQLESTFLHRVLGRVDPVTADRLHPNNKRKIIRALEVLREDGRPLSRILQEQRIQTGGSNLGGPLRYRNVVIFWLRCDQQTLNQRLDSRVDAMVAQGLLAEIRTFYEQYVKPYDNNDFERGILQSIGFKEFAGYLERFDSAHDALITDFMKSSTSDATEGGNVVNEPPEGLPLLRRCLDNLKMVTQRYSRKQTKWINHRFLGCSRREVPPIYALDTSDVSRWDERVLDPASRILEAAIAGTACPIDPLPKLENPREGLNEETSFHCAICNRTFVGQYQWQLHLNSNRHKKCLASRNKKARTQSLPEEVKS
ncbi:tRNA dimethylallyltransferase [Uranotaenia lowii]|uniref:tRNA dimethylallyltransferase n=1 Tax=Uranotaenia lowii TaxID=190385 RepID=UPI0024787ADC|nr:tRNA dimethylallyltransferase [Uranotaenia lowii]